MEEKNKQIEELEKLLLDRIINKTWRANKVAKELYEMIIPEGAVVLTEKELKEKIDCCDVSMIHHDDDGKRYIEYERHEDFTDRLGKRIQQLQGQLKQERKETAKRFEDLVEFHSVSTRDEDGHETFTISALCLKEILREEFGVEEADENN